MILGDFYNKIGQKQRGMGGDCQACKASTERGTVENGFVVARPTPNFKRF
jgi:hypothetical protein